ncbi:MAG: transposase [Bacteroidales bacterium]|nr:transposase [Bacteroidales bacterium]
MFIQDSTYSKRFQSNNLTVQKYGELYDIALKIRNLKNEVSQYVCEHIEDYVDMNKFTFVTEMRSKYNVLPSSFDKQVYEDIIVAYANKFEAIKRKLTFESIRYVCCEVYKRDTKNRKKGDFKKTKLERKETRLSITLTYLARYGNESTVEWIKAQLENDNETKRKFHQSILDVVDKFGFKRLYRLALSKREQTLARYASKPIEFKSLTFRGRSRKQQIVAYNKTYSSVINAFVSLSGFERKSFDIPVKFNKDYHGSMHDYEKENPDYEYTIVFNECKKQVSVILTKKDDRYIPDASDNIVGIDVNVKHNMFTLSDGTTYDYDRKLVKVFSEVSKRVDELKANDKEYKVGKRRQWKLDAIRHKIREAEKQEIARMCKELHEQGVTHIVMEDLNGKFGKSYIKDKCNGELNFNRIVGALRISTLKDEVEHIARKYGIAVSTVHASYTSKMCPVCGCIEDENRVDQEHFFCVECGHKENADVNAAINIRNRVAVTVLRDKLLKRLDNGAYKPRKLKRERVKEVLLSFRRSLLETGGECDESVMSTFDYV